MRYTGNIIIVNEEGLVIFERELMADEIIDVLVDAIVPEVETKKVATPKQSRKTGKKKGHNKSFDLKSCCGSRGPRHKKDCVNSAESLDARARAGMADLGAGGGGQMQVVPEEDPGEPQNPLSFYEFGMVKRYQLQGETVRAVAEELGVVPEEVQLGFNSEDYDAYKAARAVA